MEIEKVEKLVVNLHYKKEYVIHIRNLKQTLNHGLVLKKVHRAIKFNRNSWLKQYIDMNAEIKKIRKIDDQSKKEIFSTQIKLPYNKSFSR